MRRTLHRRRFHTDRIVANRRARYKRETRAWFSRGIWSSDYMDNPKRFGYGVLASRDPWDCGCHCELCHYQKFNDPRRAREGREWRRAEDVAY